MGRIFEVLVGSACFVVLACGRDIQRIGPDSISFERGEFDPRYLPDIKSVSLCRMLSSKFGWEVTKARVRAYILFWPPRTYASKNVTKRIHRVF